jgi:hypothetical protein
VRFPTWVSRISTWVSRYEYSLRHFFTRFFGWGLYAGCERDYNLSRDSKISRRGRGKKITRLTRRLEMDNKKGCLGESKQPWKLFPTPITKSNTRTSAQFITGSLFDARGYSVKNYERTCKLSSTL